MTRNKLISFLLLLVFGAGCVETGSPGQQIPATTPQDTPTQEVVGATDYEALSLLGVPLTIPEISARTKRKREADLAAAKENYDLNPDSLENIIWYGRRLAYLYRLNDAIDIYTEGLSKYPDSYRLLRHRGHRYISLRKFEEAINDFERAAFLIRDIEEPEIEPDGIPNSKNIPLSTTQFNIWYHLGLAYYLQGNFDKAISAYKRCMEVSTNDDLLVATVDWLYMTYKKTGNDDDAMALIEPIKKRMNIVENHAYHKRILMYKGLMAPEKLVDLKATNDPEIGINIATQGYGVANWYLYNGEVNKGRELLERIVQGSSWSAFGFIAAEVDLANLQAGGI